MNKKKFDSLGIMLDCSRNAVMKPDQVKAYIDVMADLGYNCLMLYTEDTYEIEGHPYFGHNRGRYSTEELRELDAYGKEKGIELIPCIQTLAHVNAIFRWPVYGEIHDCDDILLAGEEKTYELVEKMFASLNSTFSSKIVNIGMDEAHMLGRGKYQDLHGYEERFDILLRHLQKVSEIAKKYDYQLLMWGDMFFRILNARNGGGYYDAIEEVPEEVRAMVPDNVTLVYWDYYSTAKDHYVQNIKNHALIKDNIWFAGGLWTWTGFAPGNQFSINATKAALDACCEQGVKDVVLTLWGDNGGECSKYAVLPSMYYASELAKGNSDLEKIKAGFQEKYHIPFDDFCKLDLLSEMNPQKEPLGAEKYFLYNDCFMGLFDNLAEETYAQKFADYAEALKKYEQHEQYGILFESLSKLCEVHSVKMTLGCKTREAYLQGKKDNLQALLPVYDQVLELIREFYAAYEKQWMWENKPHGFDVQDIRLGGVLLRVEHCKKRLLQYINGEIERIEELEEPVLDVVCREDSKELPVYNNWACSATSNVI